MGETPPYTRDQVTRLLAGATIKEMSRYTQDEVVFVLERDGTRIELEIWAQPDWDGPSDMIETKDIGVEQTVTIRGVEL